MLRYWDGETWTQHLAPMPVPGTPAASVPAGGSPQPYRREPRPLHQRIWTRGTVAVLLGCLLLVAGSVGAVVWAAQAKAEALAGDAPSVVEQFLAAATTGDAAWRDAASPEMLSVGEHSAPLYGDITSGQQMDLSVTYSYEPEHLRFSQSAGDPYDVDPRIADVASLPVKFTYTYTVDGETFTADFPQAIWLTRPFYYPDSDDPQAARPAEEPEQVGPWRVAGIAEMSTISGLAKHEGFTSDFTDTAVDADETFCADPKSMILEMSDVSRQIESLESSCLLRQGSASLSTAKLDPKALAQGFPVMNEYSAIPASLMGTEIGYRVFPPLAQYPLTIGETQYVFTIAATEATVDTAGNQILRFVQVSEVPTP